MTDGLSHHESGATHTAPLRLTVMGDFVNRHSVLTDPNFWLKVYNHAVKEADRDGEWEMVFDEKIRGLIELKERFYEMQERAKEPFGD
jgi:hypothetical protein